MIKKYWPHILFIVFLVVLIFLTYKDYGVVWDEKYYLNTGKYYVIEIFDRLNIKNNLDIGDFQPTELHLKSHGVVLDVLTVFSTLLFKEFTFANYHLMKALLAVVTFVLVGLLVQRLTKNRLISLFSMILLFLFPRFSGDIFHNSIDVPTTLLFTLLVSYFIYYLDSEQNFLKQLGLGFISAWAINQRIILGYVFLLDLFIILLVDLSKKRPMFKFFLKVFVIGIATAVFMHLTHPYLLTHPVRGLYDMYLNSKEFQFTATNLFDGKLIWAYKLPWYYLPKYMLITVPLSVIGLFVIGGFGLVGEVFNKKSLMKKIINIYLLLLFIIPIVFVIVLKPTLYDGWRHFLFLSVPIVIIDGFGFQTILRIKQKIIRGLVVLFITVNLLMVARQMVILHPYQYIYFNELVGGLPGANGKYDTDYFGASYKEAVDWINKNVNDKTKQYKIFANGDPLSLTPFFEKNTSLVNDYNQADYCISYTRWNLHTVCPGEIVYQVEREGVPLNIIKKIP